VHGDSREPCRERRAPGELRELHVSVQVRLLHDVLGLARRADDAAHDPEQPLVVATHQDLEERRVAGDDATDDLFIGGRGKRG
jgi:hypothetical protein